MKTWKIAHILGFVLAAGVTTSAGAQGTQAMDLKGFTLGAAMTDCPSETVSRTERPPEVMCRLGPTTLANQPVQWAVVSIHDGRLAGVVFALEANGRYANSTLRDALTEKFGPPDTSKAHVNEYTWRRGNEILGLDGWKGRVVMMDIAAQERIRRIRSETGKKDL